MQDDVPETGPLEPLEPLEPLPERAGPFELAGVLEQAQDQILRVPGVVLEPVLG